MALPITQAQYGASVGGPIVHDRTFYFANFEQRELNQSGLTTISPANVAVINARLAAIGYPGPQISTGIYSNPVHNSNLFAKVDHRFSERDQFSVRYSLYHVTAVNSRGAGGLSAPTRPPTWTTPTRPWPSATLPPYRRIWSTKAAGSSRTAI